MQGAATQARRDLVEELHRLHVRAVRTERPTPWHELRVSVKRFRYAVESLLPARLAVWEEGLRQMQDLLGEIHDLDVQELQALLERSDAFFEGNPFVGRLLETHPSIHASVTATG